MKRIDMITLSAAHKYAASTKPRNNGYVSFYEMQQLCNCSDHKPARRQGWTFLGDGKAWKRAVAPYF